MLILNPKYSSLMGKDCVMLDRMELGVKVRVKYHSCDIMEEDLRKAKDH